MILVELMKANPKISLLIVSVLVTLISTLAHKWLTNQAHLKSLKERQKEIQKELKGCKDTDVMKELNAEMLKITGLMFKSSFKPMFITIIPFLILFAWLRGIYQPLMGSGWIWYYIGFSVVSSIFLRKIFKVV
ncbi:MAG: EMC3/TMCO1 family protein [archaeon]|nr:EMC3/TMCO1 family protein [archaeon]MCR4323965.1 EMC3/TMCO1 family protein [Nanoarchaeota archaeon]